MIPGGPGTRGGRPTCGDGDRLNELFFPRRRSHHNAGIGFGNQFIDHILYSCREREWTIPFVSIERQYVDQDRYKVVDQGEIDTGVWRRKTEHKRFKPQSNPLLKNPTVTFQDAVANVTQN